MQKKKTRLNFRPLVFCALGLAFGIFLYGKIRFGGLVPSDFLFILFFAGFALIPFSWKRLAAVLLCILLFAGVGSLAVHLYTERYRTPVTDEKCTLMGTVVSVSRKDLSVALLDNLYINGEKAGGICRCFFTAADLRPGDMLVCDGKLDKVDPDAISYDGYTQYLFSKDIRYTVNGPFRVVGRSSNPFLRVNRAIFDCLYSHLSEEEADVAYALLTGSSGNLDEDFGDAVRRGGVAHIFAVSGLHIGILYSAACLCFRFLKKYRFLPALAIVFFYAGVCGFSVSALRAVIMCGAVGVMRAFGKKYDFLESISLAALLVLLIFPQQWYSTGMRLSFGACLGLALFSGDFTRLLTRLRFPRVLRNYLSANLAVQLFTFPILLDAFGYVSVLGIFLNFFLIPVLPAFFLAIFVSTLLSLLIPPAAGVFLFVPSGLIEIFLFLFADPAAFAVISGFSLGAGGTVYLIGCVALSSRFRLSFKGRCVAAAVLALLFALTVTSENVVFSGVRIDVYVRGESALALVRSNNESVLLIDGDVSSDSCEDFLRRTFGGRLDAVAVLSEDALGGIGTACLLNTDIIYYRTEIETGLDSLLQFGETFEVGALDFRFESNSRLTLSYRNRAVEFDFEQPAALDADLFIGGERGSYRYYL